MKNKIIEVASQLIHFQGYTNTGLKEILDKAGVPKGSFYHYFRNKEDLALNILDYYSAFVNELFANSIAEHQENPIIGLRSFFEMIHKNFEATQYSGGCPIGNLGQELSDTEENIRIKADKIFDSLIDQIYHQLSRAYDMGLVAQEIVSKDYAEFMFNCWEGAMLRAKIKKSKHPLDLFVEMFFKQLKNSV